MGVTLPVCVQHPTLSTVTEDRRKRGEEWCRWTVGREFSNSLVISLFWCLLREKNDGGMTQEVQVTCSAVKQLTGAPLEDNSIYTYHNHEVS